VKDRFRILIANKYFYRKGGDCTYTFSLMNLLEEHGHQVVPFSMQHELNIESEYSKYFVSEIDFVKSLDKPSVSKAFRVSSRSIYSLEAKKKIESLIEDTKPDIVHLQNIHQHITPSILHSIKKYDIPVVWTLHDYMLICPNHSFLSHGRVCEKCLGGKYYKAIFEKCKKGSLGATCIASIQPYIYKFIKIYDLVDKFIAPSQFLKDKMIEYGFHESKIEHISNFLNVINFTPSTENSGYFIYAGQLSEAKGIRTLIKSMESISKGTLLVLGEGELLNELNRYVEDRGIGNVKFLGRKSGDELESLFRNAMFLIMPSEWYENCPYSILEAFAYAKPVIASRIGGIPELVDDGVNGLLFEKGNVEELRDKINHLLNNTQLLKTMGIKAREKVEREYNSEIHYERIMEVYKKSLSKKVI
jgi:glycosyltransferase involved in cell wall biosynthesis